LKCRQALLLNPSVALEPYLHQLMPPLLTCCMAKALGERGREGWMDGWMDRWKGRKGRGRQGRRARGTEGDRGGGREGQRDKKQLVDI
jgi:hypothetical protein